MNQPTWVIASDIDNTLTGDLPALQQLTAQLNALRQEGVIFLILSTGRRLAQVLGGFVGESIPEADAIISQVGTEIYLPPFDEGMKPLAAWERSIQRAFSREQAVSFLQGIDGLTMQPEMYNTALKVSAYLQTAPDPDAAAQKVGQRIAEADLADRYQVVWSSGMHLDIIPAAAGKGNAIRFILEHLQLAPQAVIVAGDSGNDLSMFETFTRGIIVANAQPELKALREEKQVGRYFAREAYAAGVLEGLRHFGVLDF